MCIRDSNYYKGSISPVSSLETISLLILYPYNAVIGFKTNDIISQGLIHLLFISKFVIKQYYTRWSWASGSDLIQDSRPTPCDPDPPPSKPDLFVLKIHYKSHLSVGRIQLQAQKPTKSSSE
eukprot:TRINITY_DN7110_c0_g1_i1.p2 TRINITY_DN7110_c0_g1~~TRINITY_DN7110_c0_g1_i1.p2  ORF type:complete len:138 (-),score=1.26 TRINITY_DN7110_c0_g1_i1:363-728(-)